MKQKKMRKRLKRRNAAITMPIRSEVGRWGDAPVLPNLGTEVLEGKRMDPLQDPLDGHVGPY
jgi:hypothetical protein